MVISHIPVEIERVMKLEYQGASTQTIYAHVAKPAKKDGIPVQYAMLALFPQHGVMQLGDINPQTQRFEPYAGIFAMYQRADNRAIKQVAVPTGQLDKLRSIDDVLATPGVRMVEQNTPK